MSDATNIEWTDATWNPVTGCSAVSPGCANCYAARDAARFQARFTDDAGEPLAAFTGPTGARRAKWSGAVSCHADRLEQPLAWKKPRRVFVCSMADLFHADVPDDFIDRVFATMAACPQHTFQILTKRPDRMERYLDLGSIEPLPNVWLGTSCEDQQRFDERIDHLTACPTSLRFLSCEPLLGPINLGDLEGIGWVIAGGESGPGARDCHVLWLKSIVNQADRAGVPVFIKQLGRRPVEPARRRPGAKHYKGELVPLTISDQKGANQQDMPAALRRRDMPHTTQTTSAHPRAQRATPQRPPKPTSGEKRCQLAAHASQCRPIVANSTQAAQTP